MYASIVMPTYNRREMLEQALSAVLHQTALPSDYAVIVVDDGSSDGTPAFLADMARNTSNLKVITHSKNAGRTAARNTGILAATGDIVILIDDDIVVDSEFVAAHIDCHKQNWSGSIAVISNISYPPEALRKSNLVRYLQSRYLGHRSITKRQKLDFADLPARLFAAGAASVRRDDLIKVGMFDTDLRFYGAEDEYLGYCLRQNGVRLIYCPEAKAIHHDRVSVTRYKQKLQEVSREGYRIIRAKNPDYFTETQLHFLEPIDTRADPLRITTIKVVLRLVLNPFTVFVLEKWAVTTDHIPALYLRLIYRPLFAGWALAGQRSKQYGISVVTYENLSG